ncbi:MAG: HNH endonuclease signature motif containing protein [Gallionella sp.]
MKDKKIQKSEISITKLELLELLEGLQSSGKKIIRTKNNDPVKSANFRVQSKNLALSGYWASKPSSKKMKENEDYAVHFVESENEFWLGEYAGYVFDSPNSSKRGSVIIANPICYKITDMEIWSSADAGLLTNFLNRSGAQAYAYFPDLKKIGRPVNRPNQTPNTTDLLRLPQFTNVEIRPEQNVFRQRVKDAYQGKCAISGCDVDKALDAAHKTGLSWREHNQAEDGYLLRKDLHALYDEGLLTISDKGKVEINIEMAKYYKDFVGIKISTPIYSKD